MKTIHTAALKICTSYYEGTRIRDAIRDITEIITRHLFPVVKPSDVGGAGSYWIRINGEWGIFDAMHIHRHHDQIDEIRGPIPMPEEKQ